MVVQIFVVLTEIWLVGRLGSDALAGYAIGSRLEHLMGALAYGIGTGMTTLIGIAAGADGWARARRVAWSGSLFVALVIGTIGTVIALLRPWRAPGPAKR